MNKQQPTQNPGEMPIANEPTNKKKSIFMILLDESGSMMDSRESTIETYKSLVQKIYNGRTDFPDLMQYISLWSFSGSVIHEKIPLTKVSSTDFPELIYSPAGGTPLYDAMGTAMLNLERTIKLWDTPNDVIVNVAIITDGNENASREFTHKEVVRNINRLKESNWHFQYYGADHDVEKVARELNIEQSMKFDKSPAGFVKMGSASYVGLFNGVKKWLSEEDDSFK